ncbi:methanogenesis marker protein Mmp4/MtxX [Methanobacterium paludis]|uniref:Methanogen marker protein 4 n=1 Tax=Methanobacterium paludis (strain DSM 25820 / JCM 18151 / SWAN1) TaxID=868131 RepID=F6D4N6_METPW|nr:methanogenesis marker protein Mmp4/MtxX [Methanobacterium paludis]AEG17521.1 methanogen marker protein 4 [Methanobacterium paludis]
MKVVAGVGTNKSIVEASRNVDFEVILTESEDELVDLLLNGSVDAAVRGSLSASKIMAKLRVKYQNKILRASFLEINGHKFLLAPVGIDEGDSVSQKVQIVESGAEFLLELGIKPQVAVLSGGRAQDKGRSQRIDDSIAEGELVTAITRDKYSVKHYFILIEDALKEGSNFILAPDGITGNIIFRTLVLVGGIKSHGAVTLGIDEIFVDTSRSQDVEGYVRALKFSHYLAKLKTKKTGLKY